MTSANDIGGGDAQWLFMQIEPLDTLFFRDARPFDAASRATSGLAKPQTVAGALRTAMLRRADIDLDRVAKGVRKKGWNFPRAAAAAGGAMGAAIGAVRFRGPWFMRNEHILYPAPATLRKVRDGGAIVRLDPLEGDLPGWKPRESGMKPLWRRNRDRLENLPRDRYLTADGMKRFLGGCLPESDDIVSAEELYDWDDRTGIALDPESLTAAEGMIYALKLLVLHRDVYLCVGLRGPAEAVDLFAPCGEIIALGGEGRRAIVSRIKGKAPSSGMDNGGGRRLFVLTTPALMNGWRPSGIRLIAAAVRDSEAVSGWDLARGGPKPNRFAVPAGSVYFLPSGEEASGEQLFADLQDAALGWGGYLEGTWNYA